MQLTAIMKCREIFKWNDITRNSTSPIPVSKRRNNTTVSLQYFMGELFYFTMTQRMSNVESNVHLNLVSRCFLWIQMCSDRLVLVIGACRLGLCMEFDVVEW